MDKIIKDIEKVSGGTEIIRVALREFKDSKFVDVRTFYNSSSGKEALWKPTRKGLAVQFQLLPELIEALTVALKTQESWTKGNKDE